MKRLLVAASLLALLLPAGAFAQQDVQTDKVTEFNFKDMEVGGEPAGPNAEDVGVPLHPGTTSFVLTRKNFVPELLTSVNEF